jgi:hypothetical protein
MKIQFLSSGNVSQFRKFIPKTPDLNLNGVYVTTGERIGFERGITEGRTEEARSLILRQLTRRLGTLPANVEAQVQALALPQLEALGEALLDFAEAGDLTRWLGLHPSE